MQFSGLELFLDDEMISNTRNIRRELIRPTKHPLNPLIRREFPWESSHVCLYGSILYDQESRKFRMWYNAYGKDYQKEQYLAYAESDDGVRWTKVMLDILPWPGYAKTNLVMGFETNLHGPCVIENPDRSDPRRRYLLMFDSYPSWRKNAKELGIKGRWVYTAESPDGLHWSPLAGRPAFEGKADSGQSVVWEPRTRTFRAYTRLTTADTTGQRIRIWKLNESTDFIHWSEPMELMRTDAQDGYPDMQIQQMTVTRYDGIYIGLLSLFRIAQYVEIDGGIDEGTQVNDIQLVTSRDGIGFARVADRALFMPHTGTSEFGTFGYRTAQLLLHKDQVLIYCDGREAESLEGTPPGMEIGLFTLPKDRFVALMPQQMREPAFVEMLPMRYPGHHLKLNASVVKTGGIEMELASFDGTAVIPGFAKENFVKITGDALDHAVRWQQNGRTYSINALPEEWKNKPLRLRFFVRQARIHALRSDAIQY